MIALPAPSYVMRLTTHCYTTREADHAATSERKFARQTIDLSLVCTPLIGVAVLRDMPITVVRILPKRSCLGELLVKKQHRAQDVLLLFGIESENIIMFRLVFGGLRRAWS